MATLTVEHLDLSGKRVFLRVDLNVPLEDGRIAEDTRIRAVLPTIEYCLKGGAGVILASHLGRPKGKPDPRYSLKPVAARLGELLGRPVPLLPDCIGPEVEAAARALKPGEVMLLENLRFHAGEEADDAEFARALAALADVYVNDAFAAAHRAHASIEGITHYVQPAAAGLLMQRELEALGRIFERPERPVAAVLGGAKVSDKLALVEHLLSRVEMLMIGGGMAFTFLSALGYGVGRSLLEADRLEAARAILARARSLGVPVRATKLKALMLSAAFISIAGSLYSIKTGFIDPESGFGILVSVQMVIIAALGGAGTLFGPLVGALILVPLQTATNTWFGGGGSGLTYILYGGIILVLARFEPGGMHELWYRVAPRLMRRSHAA